MMKLSILDQSPVSKGQTPRDALENTIALARLAEELGYERFWLAEHHGAPGFAGSAPELLIARLISETSRIRLGAGGILLRHYSPLKIAECFNILESLAPSRIDLGIGRGYGCEKNVASALSLQCLEFEAPEEFASKLGALVRYLRDDEKDSKHNNEIIVAPSSSSIPSVWLLGSSVRSPDIAAKMGLPYAFALTADRGVAREAFARYSANFCESEALKVPATILVIGAICAESEFEARKHAATMRVFRRWMHNGEQRVVPDVADALGFLQAGIDKDHASPEWIQYLVGTPQSLLHQMYELTQELNVTEIMIVTVLHDHVARMRSYTLLSRACSDYCKT